MSNNPWLALSAYQESQSDSFKGRDEDTANIVTMIQQNEYVVCYAASGDGKSSLINAGVCPKIRKLGLFPVKIEFTSDDYNKDYKIQDFDKVILEKILSRIDEYKSSVLELEPELDKEKFRFGFKKTKQYEEICDSSGMLWWKFRTETITNSLGEEFIPVLLFDQFEEVFRAPWKVQFFQWLEKLTKDICPDEIIEIVAKHTDILPSKKLFKILFSMRYEYVGELDYWCSQKNFIPQMMRNRYFLKPLTNDQARTIIYQHRNEEDKVSIKLAESANIIIESISNSIHTSISDEVPAFMLSLVCYVLYEQWAMSLAFSIEDLDIGTLIYEYYYQQIASLNMPEEDRNELESVLISSDGKRLRMPIIDQRLQKIDIERYLSGTPNLVSTNLFKVDNPKKPQYIEIVHDKLAEAINEERKQSQKTIEKEMRFKKRNHWVLGCFFILLFSAFVVLSFFSVKPDNVDPDAIKKIEKEALVIELNESFSECLEDIDSLYSLWEASLHATSLRAKQLRKFRIRGQDSKSYRGICYKNVLHYIYYKEDGSSCITTFYAHNAKNLGFYKHIPNCLHFGTNTQKVYLFNNSLSKIQSIICDNSNTTILIPYRNRKECQNNPYHAFDSVYYEELGWFSTMFYRFKFELLNDEFSSIFGVFVPNLVALAIILIWSYFNLYMVWLNKKTNRQTSSISVYIWIMIYTILALLLFNISLQLRWMSSVIEDPLWIPLIVIYVFTIGINNYNKVSTNDESLPVAKYCFLFNSFETKGWAILIKNALIDTGINKDDILLDFSILKHGKIDYKSALACSKSSKHAIVLLSKKDLEKSEQNSDFHRIIRRKNIHPIIIGLESFEQFTIPGNLRRVLTSRKIGTVIAFQSLFINSKETILSTIPILIESLEQKKTKAFRRFLLIYGVYCIGVIISFIVLLEDFYLYLISLSLLLLLIIVGIIYYSRGANHLFKKRIK